MYWAEWRLANWSKPLWDAQVLSFVAFFRQPFISMEALRVGRDIILNTVIREAAEQRLQAISGNIGTVNCRGSFALGAKGDSVEPYISVSTFSSLHRAVAISLSVMQQAAYLLNEEFKQGGMALLPPHHALSYQQLEKYSVHSSWQPHEEEVVMELPQELTVAGSITKVGAGSYLFAM